MGPVTRMEHRAHVPHGRREWQAPTGLRSGHGAPVPPRTPVRRSLKCRSRRSSSLHHREKYANGDGVQEVEEERADERNARNATWEAPCRWVMAVMLAMAVGVAPRPNPMNPAQITAAS